MAFGSFANVAVYRVPRGFSVVSPGSLCPGCERPIVWYDNIPLASYLILRARCRNCGVRISLRYPVVEVFTGLAWAAMVWRIGLHPELPAYLAFATALVILSAIDIEHHRLPNKVLGAASVAGAVLFVGAAAIGGRWVNLEHGALGDGRRRREVRPLPRLPPGVARPAHCARRGPARPRRRRPRGRRGAACRRQGDEGPDS